jgi:ceramide glucosyltransferase
MAIDTLDLFFALLAAFAATATLAASGALIHYTRRRNGPTDHTPPVTIFKPLKGLDEHLEANLRSFFALDYPCFQLVFGVADPDDPAIPVVERLMAEHAEHDAVLVVGNPAFGLNPKIENLAAMYPARKHDVILVSDSNVRVRPEYLRETVAYLADPSVGIVTNVFAGVGERRFAAVVENFQLNGFIAASLCGAFALRLTCVVGKSMLMPVRALEAIGGLAAVRNLLAEDQAIAVKVRKAGYALRLSHHVVENVNEDRDLRWFLNRHSRWLKIRYQMAFPSFVLEPLAYLPALGLVWALASGSELAWFGCACLMALSMARDAVQTRRLRGTWPEWRHLPISLLKDVFLLPIWIDALVNRRISWRGHRFIIGRFTRVRAHRVSRAARRRVRRVRRVRRLNGSPVFRVERRAFRPLLRRRADQERTQSRPTDGTIPGE